VGLLPLFLLGKQPEVKRLNYDPRSSNLLNHLNHSVLVETLLRRSIEERTEMLPVDFELSWMDPIIDSPREKKLPEEKNEAQRVAYRAAR